MRGHKISTTRQFNRHWQSGGGSKPSPFADICNVIEVPVYNYREYTTAQGKKYSELNSSRMYLLPEINRIVFSGEDTFSDNVIIPYDLEISLNGFTFNTTDLVDAVRHNITLRYCYFGYGGSADEFIMFRMDTTKPKNERYLDFNFGRSTEEKITVRKNAFLGLSNDKTYYMGPQFFNVEFHPVKENRFYYAGTYSFDRNLMNWYKSYPYERYPISGAERNPVVFTPIPSDIFGYKATYDINNLIGRNGNIILSKQNTYRLTALFAGFDTYPPEFTHAGILEPYPLYVSSNLINVIVIRNSLSDLVPTDESYSTAFYFGESISSLKQVTGGVNVFMFRSNNNNEQVYSYIVFRCEKD